MGCGCERGWMVAGREGKQKGSKESEKEKTRVIN